MHDIFVVRRRKAVRDLDGDINCFANRQAAARQQFPERLSLQKLGDDVR
jgi:hypothetical protein